MIRFTTRQGAAILLRPSLALQLNQRTRMFSTTSKISSDTTSRLENIDVEQLLSTPTWSASSLLPQNDTDQPQEISSEQLRHLLRLSALPPPKDAAEEVKMLETLSAQLHFVKEIQRVDTTGVKPLQSLRDETSAGEHEAEIGLESMKQALALEEVTGKHHRRIRRKTDKHTKRDGDLEVLGTAERKAGRYFVVDGGKNP